MVLLEQGGVYAWRWHDEAQPGPSARRGPFLEPRRAYADGRLARTERDARVIPTDPFGIPV